MDCKDPKHSLYISTLESGGLTTFRLLLNGKRATLKVVEQVGSRVRLRHKGDTDP